jgi:hypothetical protein
MLGALSGHVGRLRGLWLYAMAVAGAVTVWRRVRVGGLDGADLFLVVVGNAAAAGPVGRPLLSRFYSTFSGSFRRVRRRHCCAASLLRRQRCPDPLVTLAIWGAVGCLLAILATASR